MSISELNPTKLFMELFNDRKGHYLLPTWDPEGIPWGCS